MITPQQAIERLISNNELFYDEMTDLMRQIMSGQVPPEQIAAILTGLRIKVETVSEITAAAAVMRDFAAKVPLENSDDLGCLGLTWLPHCRRQKGKVFKRRSTDLECSFPDKLPN